MFINLTARSGRLTEDEWERVRNTLLNETDEKITRQMLATLLHRRPRPLTPQMICGMDESGDPIFAKNYSELLDWAKAKIGSNALLPSIADLFALDGGDGKLLLACLSTLTNLLKELSPGPSTKLDNTVYICRRVMESDFLTCAVVLECLSNSSVWWNDLVQMVVSLPSRVANKMGAKTPDFFTRQHFVYVVFCHVLKCMQIVAECERNLITTRIEPVGVLFGKTVSYLDCDGDQLKRVVRVFEAWCCKYEYKVVERMFASLEGNCLNRVALAVLSSVADARNMPLLLGRCIGNPRWRYCLCDYMLFKAYHQDDRILVNLIWYLRNDDKLGVILENLLDVWGDKSALSKTPFEQHLYISKAIVLAVKALSQVSAVPTNEVQSRLLVGVPNHLEASEERIRAVGMIVVDLVFGFVNPGGEIVFEYEELRKDSKYIVEQIRAIGNVEFLGAQNAFVNDEDPLEGYLSNLKMAEIQPIPPIRVMEDTPAVVKSSNTLESDDEPWDSDDELEPYDLSNDAKISQLKRPRYLRDLIDGLLEQKDADIWIGSVEACERLVKEQLPNDDPCLGIEILGLMLTLERQFYMEDFEAKRYEASVAVVNVYPEQGATYICEQFHQAAGKYTISNKMLMLDVLVGSARDLAALKSEPETNEEAGKWKSLIERRIDKNTRYITKKRPKPVTKANDFNSCVGYFFYPLIRGSAKRENIMVHLVGVECHPLMAQYLDALAVIMCSTVNCTMAGKMAKELVEFVVCFREHADFKIRCAFLRCIAAVLVSLPRGLLMEEDMFGQILRVHSWMEQVLQKGAEPNTECRILMGQVFGLMKSCFSFKDL